MDELQWKSLNIPMGLVNQIKKCLSSPQEDEDMQIDSTQRRQPEEAKKPDIVSQLRQTGEQRNNEVPVCKIDLDTPLTRFTSLLKEQKEKLWASGGQ
mmetsp:Transcript_16807/g.25890  ORF Transcript_16807/g.25890 Transcript_16807/m.25890 type:complete len:97 (+) Transcript_16807:158-448(+)